MTSLSVQPSCSEYKMIGTGASAQTPSIEIKFSWFSMKDAMKISCNRILRSTFSDMCLTATRLPCQVALYTSLVAPSPILH